VTSPPFFASTCANSKINTINTVAAVARDLRRPSKYATLRICAGSLRHSGTSAESFMSDRQSNAGGSDIYAKSCSFLSAGRSRGFED